jgi:signal transduction histidine kinase
MNNAHGMLRPAITKNSIILLGSIISIAAVLSVISFQFLSSTSDRITEIASQEIRSNTRIEAHDLSQLLANRLQTITALLQTMADDPALQNNDYQRAFLTINYRQNSTGELTDFYMWLNEKGKIVWISHFNETGYKKYKDFDLNYRAYFTVPKSTHLEYYSSLIESNDKIPRLYISYPIIQKRGPQYNNISNSTDFNGTREQVFKGIVVAGVKGTTIGNILENQLLSQFNSTVTLVDSNGIILYTNNRSMLGEHLSIFPNQSIVSQEHPISSDNSLSRFFKSSLVSNTSGIRDIRSNGTITTIAYEPVTLMGQHFLTLYVMTSHKLARNVAEAIGEQRNFNSFIILIIAAVALCGALLVLTWNKRLERLVRSRTDELRKSNTMLLESNKQLAAANEQLAHKDKAQNEFINIAAHELRTPIQPILTIGDLLRAKIKDKEQRDLVDTLIRNAKRLQRLTQDILDITMIESHVIKLNKQLLNLKDLISKTVQDYAEHIERSKSKVKILFQSDSQPTHITEGVGEKEEKPPMDGAIIVNADSERITQVLLNLLDNAVKFTEEGTITVTMWSERSEVIVKVVDSGQGIDPDIKARLFSKFATSSYRGLGLGLYISKSVIEAHGGKMWAENNHHKGASFYFSLPLVN